MRASNDLQVIRDVTANLFFWQGFRLIPMGVALLAVTFILGGAIPVPRRLAVVFAVMLLMGATAMSSAAGAYYRRVYGSASPYPGQHAQRDRWKWLVVYPLMIAATLIDIFARPTLFVSGLVWAAAVLAYRMSTGRGRNHYFVAAALMAATAFLPSFGVTTPGVQTLHLFVGLLGAVYIVGGLLDHFELTRVFHEVEE